MFEATLNESQSRLHKALLASMGGLIVFGLAFVYSATMVNEPVGVLQQFREQTLPHFLGWLWGRTFFKQFIWYALGGGVALALNFMDYRTLARFAVLGYWASIGLLVAVLIPGIGVTHDWGARRWIDLGPFQCQPSEFAKLAFIVALAHFLSRPVEELRQPPLFWKSAAMMACPFLLILKEPDLGSAIVFVPVWFAMLLVAGVPQKFLIRLVAVAGVVAALFLVDVLFAPPGWQIKLHEYQRQRLLVYFGKDFAPANATPAEKAKAREEQAKKTYQGKQALISVGSGGLLGKGWRKGDQTALGFLPRGAAHNDFIFSVIAEESGFLGSLVVLVLYGGVLLSGISIAGQARDRLGKLMAVGVVALIFSHVFINIGMNIRLMPVTGVPLPLLSYGGSSVLVSMIAMGLLHNVHTHRRTY
jgi:rod shape determining protein RodA